jgi:16S rRNA (cytidine1402-2'-O)-methyltransferase
LEDIQAVFGDREVAVARELTKKFEETKRGPAKDLLNLLQAQKPRGEFVVVV